MFFIYLYCLIIGLLFHTNAIISYEKEKHLSHECGIAVVRLLKPLSYFKATYDDDAWGLHKACLLLEKQRNRGQDGAGLAIVEEPPLLAITQYRSTASNALEDLFRQINNELAYKTLAGTLYLGHTRYGTYGAQGLSFTQPIVRKHNVLAQTFALCGNFNMTNITQLKEYLATSAFIDKSAPSDTKVIRDLLAYHLDRAIEKNYSLPLVTAVERAAMHWDGGYVIAFATGTGDLLVMRDPVGIRPCFIYHDSEVIAAASERVALMSTFNTDVQTIYPLLPGSALMVTAEGHISYHQILPALPIAQCSFERIYFSRGNDPDIYQERKNLGKNLASRVLQAIEYDLEHTIFTFIPNTSEVAFLGLVEEIKRLITVENALKLSKKIQGEVTSADLYSVVPSVQIEKIVNKDQLLRTFITQETDRLHLIANIYDVTRNVVTPDTRLVVLDDSIVRGATLRESIIKQLIMLNPKEIIIVSSAPPILYPDCYGIDMSQIGKLIGFQAAVEIVKEQHRKNLIDEIAQLCKQQESLSSSAQINYVARLYQDITQEKLEEKIAQLVCPSGTTWNGKITIIYQTIEGLHKAIPEHTGDWYFTGKYPTPGGYHVLNTSFLQWYCKLPDQRAY